MNHEERLEAYWFDVDALEREFHDFMASLKKQGLLRIEDSIKFWAIFSALSECSCTLVEDLDKHRRQQELIIRDIHEQAECRHKAAAEEFKTTLEYRRIKRELDLAKWERDRKGELYASELSKAKRSEREQ